MSANLTEYRTADESAFELAIRRARAITASSIVPEAYRGEKGLANAMIAMEVAQRIGASPLQVMQNLYVVQGRPSWSSTFLIATVNGCGRFTPLRFETQGDDPEADGYRVRAVAKDRESGDVLHGTWITWKMVKAEGWHSKTGSKWKTMPEQMFMYRAAAFWTRMYAPELSLGIHTADEVQDMGPTAPVRQATSAEVADLGARLRERAALEHQSTPAADVPAASSSEASDAPAAGPITDDPPGFMCSECLEHSPPGDECVHCGAPRT